MRNSIGNIHNKPHTFLVSYLTPSGGQGSCFIYSDEEYPTEASILKWEKVIAEGNGRTGLGICSFQKLAPTPPKDEQS